MKPTNDAYRQMQEAFDYYNEHLFEGRTKPCLVTFFRNKRSQGYFCKERFSAVDGSKVDEIAMNVALFAAYPLDDIFGTLVHEMAHGIIEHSEHKSRKGYHNKQWGDLMESVGLMPSSTGIAGGAKVGQKMSHYSIPGGRFDVVTGPLIESMRHLKWFDRYVTVRPESIKLFMKKVTDSGGSRLMAEIPAFEFSEKLGLILPGSGRRSTGLEGDEEGDEGEREEGAYIAHQDEDDDGQVEKITTKNAKSSDDIIEVVKLVDDAKEEKPKNSSNRYKYSCPSCHLNLWGKSGVKVTCKECNEDLVEE